MFDEIRTLRTQNVRKLEIENSETMVVMKKYLNFVALMLYSSIKLFYLLFVLL